MWIHARPRSAALAFVFLLAAACDDAAAPRVAELTLDSSALVLRVGDSHRLTASADDPSGRSLEVPVSWESSDTAIVAVDPEGGLVARAVGEARITARAAGVSASAEVEVLPAATLRIAPRELFLVSGSPSSFFMLPDSGFRLALTVEGDPSAAIRWTSSDTAVVSVSQAGLVTARAPGSALVRAAVVGWPSMADSVSVAVGDSLSPAIETRGRALWECDTMTVRTPRFEGPVLWASSDTTVLRLDRALGDFAVVSAVGAGMAYLSARVPDDPDAVAAVSVAVDPLRGGLWIARIRSLADPTAGLSALRGEVEVVTGLSASPTSGVAEAQVLVGGTVVASRPYQGCPDEWAAVFDSRDFANGTHGLSARLLTGSGAVLGTVSGISITIAN